MDRLSQAIQAAMLGRWQEAKNDLRLSADPAAAKLLALFKELDEAEGYRRAYLAAARSQIGNPLAAVRAKIEAMADGVLARTDDRMNEVLSAVKHAADALDDVREPTIEDDAEPEYASDAVDVCAVVKSEMRSLNGMASLRGVMLVRAACNRNACASLRIDAKRLERTLRRLLITAIRCAPKGGRITIGGCTRDGQLEIALADGAGRAGAPTAMPSADVAGTGLASVAEWLRRNGGGIEVARDPDSLGQTFIMRFPGMGGEEKLTDSSLRCGDSEKDAPRPYA